MARPLIAIISHRDGATWRQAIRDTWLQKYEFDKLDFRFFVGDGEQGGALLDDTVHLPLKDDYEHIIYKVQAAISWSLWRCYTHVFVCFTDTYVNVDRLLESEYQYYLYTGHFTHHPPDPQMIALVPDHLGRFDYASGGCGYFVAAPAGRIIANTPIPKDMKFDDLWFGTLLGKNKIAGYHDPRYGFKGTHLYNNEQISVHLSKGTGNYDPQQMYQAHKGSK